MFVLKKTPENSFKKPYESINSIQNIFVVKYKESISTVFTYTTEAVWYAENRLGTKKTKKKHNLFQRLDFYCVTTER